MRILLTGASGYLGQHLLRELLARGHTVTAAVRDPARLGAHAGAAQVWPVDLDEPEALARVPRGHDALVHAALIWGPEGAEHRDTAAAARLFALPVERAVYVSSAAVHRPFAPVMSEDDPVAPVDPYGKTKRAGELALRAAYGPRGVVIRPGPLVGPPAWPGAPVRTDRRLLEVARLAKEGLPIEVARGDGRQFSDVRAVARAVGALVSASDPHPTYLCVDREVTPWARVAEWAAAAAGSSSQVVVRDPAQAAPRFRTERVEGLIGGPASAEEALKGHLRWLFAG